MASVQPYRPTMTITSISALLLVTCVAISNQAEVPLSLSEIFTGSWANSYSQSNSTTPLSGSIISTFTQNVDNYNTQNNATFQQRFISNGQYFQAGRPIYLVLGGYRPITQYQLESSLIASVARSERGHLFLLENRFYGASIPTADLSIDNLQYLTVEQSLADVAHFVSHIKSVTPGAQDSPVVVVGFRYGGSIATWFRQKYPHLTVGAWASSAALEAIQNHQTYKENAAATLRELAGAQCYDIIEAGFRGMEQLAIANDLAQLNGIFNVCDSHPLDSASDVSTLFLTISEIFTAISTIRETIPYVCYVLEANATNGPVRALAEVAMYFTEGQCLYIDYEQFIDIESNIEVNNELAYLGLRQYSYQVCTQLGGFPTSDSPNHPFGARFPLSYFTELCVRVFGEDIAGHAVAQTNQDRFNVQNGGINPVVTNALFTHGELDPSRNRGVRTDQHDTAVAIMIPDGGVAYDFAAIDTYDPQDWIETKLDIMAVIRSWTTPN